MTKKYYRLLLIIFTICWGGPMHTLLNYHVWRNLKKEVRDNFMEGRIIDSSASNPNIFDSDSETKKNDNETDYIRKSQFFDKFNRVYSNQEKNIRNGFGDADQFRGWVRLPSILTDENVSVRNVKKKFLKELINNTSNVNEFNKIRYEYEGHASPDTAMLSSRYYLSECKRLYELALKQSGDTRKKTLFESAKYLSYCLHFLEDILCPVHNRRIFAARVNKPIELDYFHKIYESADDYELRDIGNYALKKWNGQHTLGLTTNEKSLSDLYNYINNASLDSYNFKNINSVYGEDVFYNDVVRNQLLESSDDMIKIMMNKGNISNRENERKKCYIRDIKQSFHYLLQYLKGSMIRDFFGDLNSNSLEKKSLIPFLITCSNERFELSNNFKIEYGKVQISSNNTSAKNIKFKSKFNVCPVVLVSLNSSHSEKGNIRATDVTTEGFNLRNKISNNPDFDVSYVAIGG